MSSEIRLAYVGLADAVSPWLLRGIGQSAGRFVAVCCDDAAQAERAAAEFHARWPFHGIRTLLHEAQPHGVIVAGAVSQRAAIVKQCLAAGAAVLTIGVPTMAAGKSAARGNAFVFAGAAGRFSPAGTLVQRLLESGKLGELLSVSLSLARARAARSVEEAAWPVGHDGLFEALDWAAALCGPVREVFSRGHADGAVHATLVSQADVPVSVRVYEHGRPEAAGLALELRGVDGTLLTLNRGMRLECRNGSRELASHTPALGAADPAVEFGYVGLINEFLRRIVEGDARPAATMTTAAGLVEAVMGGLSKNGAVKVGAGRGMVKTS